MPKKVFYIYIHAISYRLLRRFACAILMPPQRELTQRAREDSCWPLLLKGIRLEDVLNHALLSRKLAKRLEHRWHGLTSAMARWPYAHLTRTLRQQLLHMPINNCWFGYGDRQNSLRKKKTVIQIHLLVLLVRYIGSQCCEHILVEMFEPSAHLLLGV